MKIREIERSDRAKRFGLEYYVDGKRRRRYFQSAERRAAARQKIERAAMDMGSAGVEILPEDVVLLKRCREIIGPTVTLFEVCQFWAQQHRSVEPMDIEQAKDLFAIRRKQEGLSDGRIRSGDAVLDNLAAAFTCEVGGFTEGMLTEWILGLPREPETKRSYRNHLKSFFDFSAEQGWCVPLDFSKVKYGKVIEKEAVIMPVDELKALLKAAWADHPLYCGYFALCIFGGLRTSAACRLDYDNINFEERGILMPAADSKTEKRHYVDGFPDVLWAWLEAVNRRVGRDAFRITPRAWNRARAEIAKEAGVVIPHNGLRKSFASYMVAATGSADRVATLMTHRNPGKLYQTYKGNAKHDDGLAFLEIVPD